MLRQKLLVLGVLTTLSTSALAALSTSPSGPGTYYAGASIGASNFSMPNFVYGSQSGGSSLDFSTNQTVPHGELIFGIVFKNAHHATPAPEAEADTHPKKKKKKAETAPTAQAASASDSKMKNMRMETSVRYATGSTNTQKILSNVNLTYINGQTSFFNVASETNNQLKTELMFTDINLLFKADFEPDALVFSSSRITLTPFLGPSILLMNQKFTVNSVPTNNFAGSSNIIEEELSSKYYGLKMGANGNYLLNDQFNIFAGLNFSYLNGSTNFDGKQVVTNTGGFGSSGTYTTNSQNSQSIMRLGAMLGGSVLMEHGGSLILYSDFDRFNKLPFADNPSNTTRSAAVGYKSATVSSVGLTYVYPF